MAQYVEDRPRVRREASEKEPREALAEGVGLDSGTGFHFIICRSPERRFWPQPRPITRCQSGFAPALGSDPRRPLTPLTIVLAEDGDANQEVRILLEKGGREALVTANRSSGRKSHRVFERFYADRCSQREDRH
jgi:hypothetical protein